MKKEDFQEQREKCEDDKRDMNIILCNASYSNGYSEFHYTVEKELLETGYNVLVKDCRKNGEVVSSISCLDIPEYETPFLSWYNLIFCSAHYGALTDYEYMNRAVQTNKKTAATIYLSYDSPEGQQLIKDMPDCCAAMPYGETMIYMYHKGSLSDYFDFERIRDYYDRYGVFRINWSVVKKLFQKDLSYFGHENECGFSLQNSRSNEEMIIIGLIFGYPLVSTAARIKRWDMRHYDLKA